MNEPKLVTVRDLVDEAMKRIVILAMCALGLSYLMSLTSTSVLVNFPAAASLIILLRYFPLDYVMRRRAAVYCSKPASTNASTPKQPAERSKVKKSDWRKKVNSPVVEDAIDQFSRHLVSEWLTDLWYSGLTPDREGPEELVQIINGVLGEFSDRLRSINLIYLLRDLIDLIRFHLEFFRINKAKIEKQQYVPLTVEHLDTEIRRVLAVENKLHPALFSAEAEHKVLQHLMDGLISFTFRPEDLRCSFFRCIVRELLACAVMQPVLNLVSPRFINERIASAVISMTEAKGGFNAARDESQFKPNGSYQEDDEHDLVDLKEVESESTDSFISEEEETDSFISEDEGTDSFVSEEEGTDPFISEEEETGNVTGLATTDTRFFGIPPRGPTAASFAAFVSNSDSSNLTANSFQSLLEDYSFLKMRCEIQVLGANIVKSGSRTFAVYSILVTDVNHNNSWSIKRRLRLFEELHQRLQKFPDYELHLPPKHFLSTYLEIREQLLDGYLKKLLQHPTISRLTEVWDFLKVDSKTYVFSNSLSIVETPSVDHDDHPSEKSKKASIPDAATHSILPTEWEPPNLSVRILDLAVVIFQLRDSGWIRRLSFRLAKKILKLGMGDAFDYLLLEKVQLLRKGSVVASGIKWIEQILWPDGIFITKHQTQQCPPSSSSPSQASPRSPQSPERSSPRLSNEQQELEAEHRAKLVYELMIDKAPAGIVGLVGRKKYEQCAKDLSFFIQSSVCLKLMAYDLVELLLLSAFPELDHVFKQLHY